MVKEKTMRKPVWLKYTEEEIKEIIAKLMEKDSTLTSEKIGLILRDTYGIPSTRLYGIKIGQVLKEKGLYQSADLKNITKKEEDLHKHLQKNKGDKKAGRSLITIKSRLKKLKEYLK